ncbi:MAG: ATP-binding domain-containing protein [Acidimicrobiia bacterium]
MSTDAPLFPELDQERDRLAFARACRDSMIERLTRVDPNGAADEITKQYIEMTVADALADLRTPGAGDFFGRIDEEGGDSWYVGRRHIETAEHDPVVVDWRAPIAAPFYRATVADPFGLRFRRRFTLGVGDRPATDGQERDNGTTEITAYLDEHLDDPDAHDGASGIPDPVLAEIGAARTGAMREIVATIQAEQDIVIRAPLDGCLIVQGGPGTGKTAVGLHRAAYLLFEHRRRLSRDGVLVVGPNRAFLEYIANVLPSLGERSVQQRTIVELASPRVDVDGADPTDVARLKGDARLLAVLERAVRDCISPPSEGVRVPLGARTIVFEAEDIAGWITEALAGSAPINRRRDGLRALAQRELLRRTGNDDAWTKAEPLRKALDKAWPPLRPLPIVERVLGRPEVLAVAAGGLLSADEQQAITTRTGRHKRWTAADQLLLDEANSILNGPKSTFGHVVVDEAQDLSAVGLRAIGRRSTTGSFTILGDLAQSTTPAGQAGWDAVRSHLDVPVAQTAVLTVGYRVPAGILEHANRLLPLTGVDVPASRSVRETGAEPQVLVDADAGIAELVARAVEALRHHHRLIGVVAPDAWHDPITETLARHGRRTVDHVQQLADDEIAMFSPEAVKGLEFDGVVVAAPHEILDGTPRGARLLYVAMTRAVQELYLVSDRPLPPPLG